MGSLISAVSPPGFDSSAGVKLKFTLEQEHQSQLSVCPVKQSAHATLLWSSASCQPCLYFPQGDLVLTLEYCQLLNAVYLLVYSETISSEIWLKVASSFDFIYPIFSSGEDNSIYGEIRFSPQIACSKITSQCCTLTLYSWNDLRVEAITKKQLSLSALSAIHIALNFFFLSLSLSANTHIHRRIGKLHDR